MGSTPAGRKPLSPSSALSKFAQCVWYRSQDEPTEEAKRGERINTLYRALLAKRLREDIERLTECENALTAEAAKGYDFEPQQEI